LSYRHFYQVAGFESANQGAFGEAPAETAMAAVLPVF
jgi:hypothetical protein